MDCLRPKALQDLHKLSSVTVLNIFWCSLCYFAIFAERDAGQLVVCSRALFLFALVARTQGCPSSVLGFSCCFSFSCAHPVSERSIAEGRSTELLAGTSLLSVAPFCSIIQRSLWFVLTQETLVQKWELFHSKKDFFVIFQSLHKLCCVGDNFGAVFPSLYIHFVVRSWVGKCLQSVCTSIFSLEGWNVGRSSGVPVMKNNTWAVI